MVKKIMNKKGQEVLELNRFERIWFCSECKKEFPVSAVPTQCSCGAEDKVFMEKTLPIEESPRKLFTIQSNIIYEGDHIPKDSIVSLIIKDRVTKNLLSRKLISECKEVEAKLEEAKI